jgi:queuosine precursor transporter
MKLDKRTKLLLILAGIFITSAVTAELISSKLFEAHVVLFGLDLGNYISIVGIIPWPIVFLTTDTMNEFYGPKVVRSISYITCAMIAFCFLIVYFAMKIPAWVPSPPADAPADWKPGVANDVQFNTVFGQSQWIILGSITAFLVSQLLDSFVFWFVRKRTGGKMIWLRSTGSTLVSQLIDSFIVLYIGFVIPGIFSMKQFVETGLTNYVFKLMIAVMLTPVIYLAHWAVKRYLGKEASIQEEIVAQEATGESL